MLFLARLAIVLSSLQTVFAIWPAPRSASLGNRYLYINQDIEVSYNGGTVCWNTSSPYLCSAAASANPNPGLFSQLTYTAGYNPTSLTSQQVVQAGVSRALDTIFRTKFVPWMLRPRGELAQYEPEVNKGRQATIKSLRITQTGTDGSSAFKPLAGEVDESYNLTVSACGTASLSAVSSYGVLHGLQSFTQLFYQHSTGTAWYTPYAPVSIQDAPRYVHRGVILDVARNYFPVSDILRTIDGLAWNKMNRLHIHATDSQSFPLVIPSLPEVAEKGAYSPDQVYTPSDLQNIQEYGAARGVEVYIEIDMPGHSGLWWSHPELNIAADLQPYWYWCNEPPCGALKLNDTAVDGFLGKLFDDLFPRLSPYTAYFHTGGDELNANDSMLDPGVRSNSSTVLQPLLQKFIDSQHSRVRKAGLTPLVWEEIPLNWNVTLGNDTVVQTWLGASSVATLTSQGHKVIDSDYSYWYLDCGRGAWLNFENGAAAKQFYPYNDWCGPTKSWQLVYSHDPAANLGAAQAKLVLGGEVALWAETIDPQNFDTLAWPRTSAAGEVLWSGRTDASGQNRSLMDAAPRLNEMRARMVAAGFRASPIQMTFCTQANATECQYPV